MYKNCLLNLKKYIFCSNAIGRSERTFRFCRKKAKIRPQNSLHGQDGTLANRIHA